MPWLPGTPVYTPRGYGCCPAAIRESRRVARPMRGASGSPPERRFARPMGRVSELVVRRRAAGPMRAVVFEEFGGQGPGRFRIPPSTGSRGPRRGHGLCRSDWHGLWAMTRHPLRHVPGHELAAVVEEVDAGVSLASRDGSPFPSSASAAAARLRGRRPPVCERRPSRACPAGAPSPSTWRWTRPRESRRHAGRAVLREAAGLGCRSPRRFRADATGLLNDLWRGPRVTASSARGRRRRPWVAVAAAAGAVNGCRARDGLLRRWRSGARSGRSSPCYDVIAARAGAGLGRFRPPSAPAWYASRRIPAAADRAQRAPATRPASSGCCHQLCRTVLVPLGAAVYFFAASYGAERALARAVSPAGRIALPLGRPGTPAARLLHPAR